MKIAFFELEMWEQEIIQRSLKGYKLIFASEQLSLENVSKYRDVGVVAVFASCKLEKKLLDKLPKLRFIATMSTGFDHIDLKECKKRRIAVSNVPTYGENTVAEHAFALLLALSRRLYPSIKRTHEEQRFETDSSLRGFDLKGKTLGVVGCGNIGKHVARIAKGFEMKVVVFDVNLDQSLARKVGFEYASMDELLKKSDVITLHVPYNKHTHHLLNAAAFGKMKRGVYIVNTSRGGVIDTDSLVTALASGKVSGAALDVLEEEGEIKEERSLLSKAFKGKAELRTLLEDHILMKLPNVIITPHNAFNSTEALQRIMHVTVENVNAFKRGKPVNVVE